MDCDLTMAALRPEARLGLLEPLELDQLIQLTESLGLSPISLADRQQLRVQIAGADWKLLEIHIKIWT